MPADVHESKLVLHWPGSARTFNPFSNLSLPSWFPVWFVFDQLVHLDADAQVVPQLAERWDVSDDGRPSNGRIEGTNNLLQVLRRVAHGFTNPDNFAARGLLVT